MPQLICKNLTLGYDSRVISENINLQVNKGDYLCIVGENGSGKSTLMKTLLGLQQPLSGQVVFADGFSRKQIGYLPQQTPVQKDFPASVEEIVLSGFLGSSGLRPFYSRSQKKEARQIMTRLGIYDKRFRFYRELSGGQQQRVLLARALCATKEMLLLDEPVSGLDPAASDEMYSIIAQLNREENITIIMVSHDIAASVKYASHILHMGSPLQFFGTKEEYIQSPLKGSFRLSNFVDEPLCSRCDRMGSNARRYFK